ncbi:HTH-type transcriptional regulator DegA [Botrimarina colliarenosi]|uniref:HTH-type transcriptional regulator DegA n=1 Tax=Botrimarina colliarenosi TaxID=2528001 RepID=A0A5C6A112_9BACT|nr:LacI family DNA-binding transcriptional regulator [Botrimarina colliarenosi]TWT92888.1 HTH-type transcriptional regulator DegA [Botrimarina colliarenosi]
MAVTIDQIAEQAGVSASTVARVLRGDVKGVQERSARKSREILRISAELGYQPNWRARALSRGKTHTIGLLYSNPRWIFEDPMNEIATSFTETLQEENYDIRLVPVTETSDWKELVLGGAVDGLAFLLHVPEPAQAIVLEGRLPTILMGEKFGGLQHVVTDDISGGRLAARHLLGLGHKRIALYVNETIRDHVSVHERRQGFEQAMREAGYDSKAEVWRCNVDDVMQRLLARDAPTAIICYCHVEALELMHACWSHGVSVPTDLSLIAFNDIAATRYTTPPLTVIRFDTAELGAIGARRLAARIASPEEATDENTVVRQQLVLRGTTAPPTKR